MLKPAKDEVAAAMTALAALFGEYRRGDVVPWEQIEAIVGSRNDGQAKYIIRKFLARFLVDREIATRPVINVGVKLLTEREQIRRCPKDRQRRMWRQSTRLKAELTNINAAALSLHDQKLLDMQLDSLRKERRAMRQASNRFSLFTKRESNPRGRVTASAGPG